MLGWEACTLTYIVNHRYQIPNLACILMLDDFSTKSGLSKSDIYPLAQRAKLDLSVLGSYECVSIDIGLCRIRLPTITPLPYKDTLPRVPRKNIYNDSTLLSKNAG
jgi:hypothetical protein